MVKRIVPLPNVTGSAIAASTIFAAHTVTVDLPVGPRYHVIWIAGNAGTGLKADALIGEIRVKINGKVQRVFTLLELLKLNTLNNDAGGTMYYAGTLGQTNAGAFNIPIWFAEPWRKSLASQDALAWGTGDVTSFQIEFDIKAYAAGVTLVVPLTLRAEIDNSEVLVGGSRRPQPLGLITKWQRFNYLFTVAGGWSDSFALQNANFAIQSIHINDTSISEFEIIADNSMIRKNTQSGNNASLVARSMNPSPAAATGDAPTHGMTHIVFDHDDVLENALSLRFGNERVQSLNIRFLDTAVSVRGSSAIAQVIGPAE